MIGNELIFVYGLIGLVIILIIIIIIIDRKETKKRPQNLFDTLNMKIINDTNLELAKEKEEPEILEIKEEKKVDFSTVNNTQSTELINTEIKNKINEIEEYIEPDLEKTQAQIRVEEITNALKEAQIDEKIEEDKYKKFEEEQEKNAIISYNELKESFDKLYEENEKIQYLEDNTIPINIEELYQLKEEQEKEEVVKEVNKVTLNDFSDMLESPKVKEAETSTFKNSPLLSPVYGIQEPPIANNKSVDLDIQSANQFLQNLKELKNNLD